MFNRIPANEEIAYLSMSFLQKGTESAIYYFDVFGTKKKKYSECLLHENIYVHTHAYAHTDKKKKKKHMPKHNLILVHICNWSQN